MEMANRHTKGGDSPFYRIYENEEEIREYFYLRASFTASLGTISSLKT